MGYDSQSHINFYEEIENFEEIWLLVQFFKAEPPVP